MSGALGTGTAIGGFPTGFVLARAGTPRHRVRADLAGGDQVIIRLPACVPLLIAGGRVLSIAVRETCAMAVMKVARIEVIADLDVTNAAIVTTIAVIVATVTKGVTSAVMTAVKIVFVTTAVRGGKLTAEVGLARRFRAMVSVAVKTAVVKRAAIVDIMESVVAIEAMAVTTGADAHDAEMSTCEDAKHALLRPSNRDSESLQLSGRANSHAHS